MYNNVIALTNVDISRNTVGKKSGNKKQRTKIKKITRRNVIIENE